MTIKKNLNGLIVVITPTTLGRSYFERKFWPLCKLSNRENKHKSYRGFGYLKVLPTEAIKSSILMSFWPTKLLNLWYAAVKWCQKGPA